MTARPSWGRPSTTTAARTTLDVGGTVNNDGLFEVDGGRTVVLGAVVNGATGEIVTQGGGELVFLDALKNAGDIATGIGGRTTIFGDYSGPGSFSGGGTVVLFENTVSTGASAALISYFGDVVMDGATTIMEVGGTARGTGYDAWDVEGTLTLDGTLSLAFLNGFATRPGDSFSLFSATGGIAGDFAALDLAPLDGGVWREVRTATTYGLAVAPIPLPAGAWLLLSGLGLLVLRRRG